MPSRAEIRQQVIDALSSMEESEGDTEEVLEDMIYIEPDGAPWRIAFFVEEDEGTGAED